MQIINVLVTLGLVGLGLMLVITGLQFGVVILLGIVTALSAGYSIDAREVDS